MNKYKVYEKQEITKELLNTIKVGDLIKINIWKKPMRVVAVSENFFIMWKKHFKTWVYSICEKNKRGYEHNLCYRPNNGFDKDEFVCGRDNSYCKFDYSTEKGCQEALKELESGELEVSERGGWGIWHIEIKEGKSDESYN